MKKYGEFLALALVFFAVASSASAATFLAGETQSLGRGETINDDLYLVGGNVSVASRITGDLMLAGGNVALSGEVLQDANIAGGNLNIISGIDGDLRAAGGAVNISGNVGEDAAIVGGQVTILSTSNIRGGLYAAGGVVQIDGTISGPVRIKADEIVLNGTLQRGAEITANKKLAIGSSAVIDGELNYKAPQEAVIENGAAVNGKVNFEQISKVSKTSGRGKNILRGLGLASTAVLMLVSGLVLTLAFKNMSQSIIGYAAGKFWLRVLTGLIVAVIAPVMAVILMITVAGVWLGLMLIFLLGAMLIMGLAYSGVLLGSYIAGWLKKSPDLAVDWKTVIYGTVAIYIVLLVPIVGKVVLLIFFLASLGCVANHFWRKITSAA